jgi:hypothetical protein
MRGGFMLHEVRQLSEEARQFPEAVIDGLGSQKLYHG